MRSSLMSTVVLTIHLVDAYRVHASCRVVKERFESVPCGLVLIEEAMVGMEVASPRSRLGETFSVHGRLAKSGKRKGEVMGMWQLKCAKSERRMGSCLVAVSILGAVVAAASSGCCKADTGSSFDGY